jgi:ABC-type phosphate transport system substrate-binding protein
MTVYIAVVAVLYVNRGGVPWQRLAAMLGTRGRTADSLTVAGRDLAPLLVDRLVAAYGRDYPDLTITSAGGGTNQALEDLLNGGADVAFLYHPPTSREQEYFREVNGDTAIVVPVAIGGVLLLTGGEPPTLGVTREDLRDMLTGARADVFERLYTTDPNEGLWDAVRTALGLIGPEPPAGVPVVFLADAAAVVAAVRTDHVSWGMVSSLDAPLDPDAGRQEGLAFVPMRAAPDSEAVAPIYENLAKGAYPLHHVLYVACRGNGGIEGAKFVTHLGSARGLRQVERAGVLPARQVLREIYLTRDPIGG